MNLKLFAAGENQLSGALPGAMHKLDVLESIFLGANQLRGTIPRLQVSLKEVGLHRFRS